MVFGDFGLRRELYMKKRTMMKIVSVVTALSMMITPYYSFASETDACFEKPNDTETEDVTMADNAMAPSGRYIIVAYGIGNYYWYKQDGAFELVRN